VRSERQSDHGTKPAKARLSTNSADFLDMDLSIGWMDLVLGTIIYRVRGHGKGARVSGRFYPDFGRTCFFGGPGFFGCGPFLGEGGLLRDLGDSWQADVEVKMHGLLFGCHPGAAAWGNGVGP
jgi:hypothetical protein